MFKVGLAAPQMIWFIGVIYAIPTLTTLRLLLQRNNYAPTESDQRVRSWWLLAAMLTAAMVLGRSLSLFFIGYLSFLTLKESVSMLKLSIRDRQSIFWGYLTIPLQLYWVVLGRYDLFLGFSLCYLLIIAPAVALIANRRDAFTQNFFAIQRGWLLAVFGIIHLAFLITLPEAVNPIAAGAGLVLYLILLTQLNDAGQYMISQFLSHHKVATPIHPLKNWLGLLTGGIITLFLAAVIAPLLTPLNAYDAALIGTVIVLAGLAGDALMLRISRQGRFAENASATATFGWIFERMIRIIFAAPFFYLWIRFFYG